MISVLLIILVYYDLGLTVVVSAITLIGNGTVSSLQRSGNVASKKKSDGERSIEAGLLDCCPHLRLFLTIDKKSCAHWRVFFGCWRSKWANESNGDVLLCHSEKNSLCPKSLPKLHSAFFFFTVPHFQSPNSECGTHAPHNGLQFPTMDGSNQPR